MGESSVYEDLKDVSNLKTFMQTQLEDYNETPGLVPMNLVLFQDAIEHGRFTTTPTSTGAHECLLGCCSLCSDAHCTRDQPAQGEHAPGWCWWFWPSKPFQNGCLHL